MRTVLDCASLFIFNVARSLSAGTIRKNRLTLDMPTDVFKFLFAGKGIGVERGYKEYNPVDFDSKYFPDEWYVHYDQNHDGCAIEFPMKMKSCIIWTRSYKQKENIDKKMFFERLYIFVVKKRV